MGDSVTYGFAVSDEDADPRSHYLRKPLHRDVEVNGVASEVAAERGLEVIDFDELGFAAYIDHIHLTPAGHRTVAERIAEVLSE